MKRIGIAKRLAVNSVLALIVLAALSVAAAGDSQRTIARVQLMAKTPDPLVVRDWPQVARQYYKLLLNPATRLDGKPLVALDTNTPSFDIASWVGKNPDDEALTCLSAVIGAKLVGLDPRNLG